MTVKMDGLRVRLGYRPATRIAHLIAHVDFGGGIALLHHRLALDFLGYRKN